LSEPERLGVVRTAEAPARRAPGLARVGLVAGAVLLVAYTVFGAFVMGARPGWASAFQLLAPVLIGGALLFLLAREGQKSKLAQAAAADSERRFRTAVEAARCGVWEWDLEGDCVYLSEVMGAMLGWGGGGEVGGGEVLARIAPEHQSRVQKGLEDAARHGAFDVSFRVPPRAPGGRSAWIDARGQAVGEPQDGVFTRLIGVALDVTEERQAEARAHAAETRLRDAIDSVSEAFVLFDARGRLLMCNRTFRELFGLEPRLLKPASLATPSSSSSTWRSRARPPPCPAARAYARCG
jgi:two-component system cell cycle sensor histidine kinase PleC